MGKKALRSSTPPPLVDGAMWIPLTKGRWALVDSGDHAGLASWNWYYNNGYAARDVRVNGIRKCVKMHRLIMGEPEQEVDHRSGDTLDNRRSNLRVATHARNMRNMKTHRDNASGFKGVSWHEKTGMWRARITVSGKTKYLGYFRTAEEGAAAYDAAAREHHGDYARTNK